MPDNVLSVNETLVHDDEAEQALAGTSERPKRQLLKLLLVAGVAIALLGAAGAGAMMWLRAGNEDASTDLNAATSYVDVPPIVVNLRSGDGQSHYLKVHFMIVATSEGKAAEIKDRLPLIVDALQSFLRELRPEDMSGSAAIFRVKEEMMIRTQATLGKGSVSDILIQDLVEQ